MPAKSRRSTAALTVGGAWMRGESFRRGSPDAAQATASK
jgi:hypothetical protein